MKHSTFYRTKKGIQIYTTIKHTPHHAMLREHYNGTTYSHGEKAILYFVYPSLPLDEPLTWNEKFTHNSETIEA